MSVSRPRRLPPYPELDAFRPRYNSLKPKEREELAHLAEMLQPYHQGKFHPDPGWYGIMSRLAQFGARLRPPVALRDEGDALARIQSRKQEAETNDKAGAKAVEELQAALRRQREECVAAAELVRNAAEELARAEMDESDRAEADELAPATNNATGPLAQKLANALLTWMSLLPDLGKQETAWNLAECWPQQGKNGDEWEIVKEWLYAGADYAAHRLLAPTAVQMRRRPAKVKALSEQMVKAFRELRPTVLRDDLVEAAAYGMQLAGYETPVRSEDKRLQRSLMDMLSEAARRVSEVRESKAAAAAVEVPKNDPGASSDSGSALPGDAAPTHSNGLELIPGGFAYRNVPHTLTGRPYQILAALLKSRFHRLTANDLREALRLNEETVDWPEQVIRDATRDLRQALRQAVASAGESCADPLKSKGRREDLTYFLGLK